MLGGMRPDTAESQPVNMRTQPHYNNMGIEVHAMCKANMTKSEYIGAMKWSIEKYVWRNKNSDLQDAQKIQVYARWMELAYDNSQIDELKALSDLIKQIPNGKYHRIYTVGRGGMYVAAKVAYALGITEVWSFPPNASIDVSMVNCLFVDDCADTGETLKQVKCDSAVLWKRESCPVKPTYCGLTVEGSQYINVSFQE